MVFYTESGRQGKWGKKIKEREQKGKWDNNKPRERNSICLRGMVAFVTVTKSERTSIIQNGHCSPDRQLPHEMERERKANHGQYAGILPVQVLYEFMSHISGDCTCVYVLSVSECTFVWCLHGGILLMTTVHLFSISSACLACLAHIKWSPNAFP